MRRLLSLSIFLLPGLAFADEATPAPEPDMAGAPRGVEQIVVSATRTPQLLTKVGASVTVISEDVLRDRQVIAVSDVIAQTPGVTFSRNGGIGGTTSLRIRGAEDIKAEEARIAAAAVADRERLLDQTRREIELQVRLAKKEILEHAADLSVQLATERIGKDITPDDQSRLVDRYLDQVKKS